MVRLVKAPMKARQLPLNQEIDVAVGEVLHTDQDGPGECIRDGCIEFVRENEVFQKGGNPKYITPYSTLVACSHPSPCLHQRETEVVDVDQRRCLDCGDVYEVDLAG